MDLRKKIKVAAILLLICVILLVSVSYAWLSLSRVPEISGIDTKIGANGSLEIALLNDSTYLDPSLIRTQVGDSAVVQDATVSNLSWGNVVDLSDESYGLNEISILPSRLNVSPGEDGDYYVNSHILAFPDYGTDGRFSEFYTNTVSAVYHDSQFSYLTAKQSYGVRGIGTISDMTSQQAALARARTSVQSYRYAASNAAISAWNANGAAIVDLIERGYILNEDRFYDADIAVVRDTAARMLGALSYIDSALRQGIVGYASSVIEDADTFQSLCSNVENTVIPLSLIVEASPVELPSGFSSWISLVDNNKVKMQGIIYTCDAMIGGSYTWAQISPLLSAIINENKTYLGSETLSALTSSSQLSEDNLLTLSSDAGVMADIAEFCGDYNVIFSCSDTVSVEVVTMAKASPAHLTKIYEILENCHAASGDDTLQDAPLNDVYGFAVDLAFRCNTTSRLLLQTEAVQRIDADSETQQTQGSGSYMSFASEQLSTEQIVQLMDAIRIAFMDNQNTLLGVAKLNTSSYSELEDGVTAPLYLYEYTVSVDGSISMGERLDEQNEIASLTDGTATVITAVVWLDGDHVDNSLAAATAKSMEGVLNLQFASTAVLQASNQAMD